MEKEQLREATIRETRMVEQMVIEIRNDTFFALLANPGMILNGVPPDFPITLTAVQGGGETDWACYAGWDWKGEKRDYLTIGNGEKILRELAERYFPIWAMGFIYRD